MCSKSFYLHLILEISLKNLRFGGLSVRVHLEADGVSSGEDSRAGQDIFPQEYFSYFKENDVAQREKTRCLARWRLSDTP